jgi:hypothetical protein
VDVDYSVSLNDMNSVPMKASTTISLIAGQIVRIRDWPSGHKRERFHVATEAYVYGFTIGHDEDEQELLTFHWNQDQHMASGIPRGHLHIGRGLLASPTVIRPGDFQNAHVPTAHVPFSAVVRFAIT